MCSPVPSGRTRRIPKFAWEAIHDSPGSGTFPSDGTGDGVAETLGVGLAAADGAGVVGAGLGAPAAPQAATSMARLPVIAIRVIERLVRRVVI